MVLQKQINDKNNSSIAVYRKEAFDIGYQDYFTNIAENRISIILNSKERNIKQNTITHRQIHSWAEQGLIDENENGGWRKFSIMDALWLRIIYELREFGMSWNSIKIVKESLEFEATDYGVAMPILEFYTAFAIANKMPVLLLVFKDGVCVPTNYTQYKVARDFGEVENHIQINLNKILQGFFPDVDLKPKSQNEIPVDIDEMELLAFVRIGQFEKIEIQFSRGKMQVVEGKERINANQILSDVIKQHKYQKIDVEVQDGKKVSIVRTIRKRLNKKG
jgi:DNA-binding transcriptional MerR regulator